MELLDLDLDLRGLPVWERPERVFASFDRLPAGGALTFVTENEPRGLTARIEQSRPHQARTRIVRSGDGRWHVTLTRVDTEAPATSANGVLARTGVFADVGDDALRALSAASVACTVKKGERITDDAKSDGFVGVVWEGVVALTVAHGARRRHTLFEVFPYEVFGAIRLFDRGLPIARAAALSKSARYLAIPNQVVRAVGLRDPALIFALASVCAQRTRRLAEALTAQGSEPTLKRVAAVLLPYALPERGITPAMAPLPTMTQSQIAAAAGTVKEVAARAIIALEKRGAVRRERGHVQFLDREKLLEIVRA